MNKLTLFLIAGIGAGLVWLFNIIRTKEPIHVFTGIFLIIAGVSLLLFILNIKRLTQIYG